MKELNKQFKELINEAIDNSFRNNIEMKIILKEWLHGMCELPDKYETMAAVNAQSNADVEEARTYK